MISGRWGKPSDVLLEIVVANDGTVTGIVNPGRQNLPIRSGHFNAVDGVLALEGEHTAADGVIQEFCIKGQLNGRGLQLAYKFGDVKGQTNVVRVEDYAPPRLAVRDVVMSRIAIVKRTIAARFRPTGRANARALGERGESLASITFRDAVATDIPALAELHVTTWNATYNTTRGPTVATRVAQWEEVFAKQHRRDFVLVLEDRTGRLIGFTWGRPHGAEFEGELSKIYLRWEYHRLGLGRRMLSETARRFTERGMHSYILFAELSNPTLGFYDHMGGERLLDERGQFNGAYGWRDLTALIK